MSASSAPTGTGPGPAIPSLEVLVIEDDSAMGAVVADELRGNGHHVMVLGNGIDALADVHRRLVSHSPLPDVIITDLRLPGMNGFQIVSSLRRLGCAMPVIVMTGFGSEDVRRKARELGATTCLDKPFDLRELCAVVADRARQLRKR